MMMNFDLKETKADTCVLVSNKNNQLLIVAIFVDDRANRSNKQRAGGHNG